MQLAKISAKTGLLSVLFKLSLRSQGLGECSNCLELAGGN